MRTKIPQLVQMLTKENKCSKRMLYNLSSSLSSKGRIEEYEVDESTLNGLKIFPYFNHSHAAIYIMCWSAKSA